MEHKGCLFVDDVAALDVIQCGCCGQPSEGNYSLDLFEDEDDVPLCNGCGGSVLPTVSQIREQVIARRQSMRSKAFDKEVLAVQL
jgi:NAD-dependent SIR2 family protein deacetylase